MGGVAVTPSRLFEALRALLPALLPREPYLGPREYRVVRMRPSASSAEQTRVELQIVRAASGMPDQLMVPAWPGVAGAHAEAAPGARVLVQFVDGDPGRPYVCAWSTRDDPAWRPATLTLDAADAVKVGPSATAVELGHGSLVVGDATGAVVRFGDWIVSPVGGAPFQLTSPPLKPFSRVKA